jgi:hypothetical protein
MRWLDDRAPQDCTGSHRSLFEGTIPFTWGDWKYEQCSQDRIICVPVETWTGYMYFPKCYRMSWFARWLAQTFICLVLERATVQLLGVVVLLLRKSCIIPRPHRGGLCCVVHGRVDVTRWAHAHYFSVMCLTHIADVNGSETEIFNCAATETAVDLRRSVTPWIRIGEVVTKLRTCWKCRNVTPGMANIFTVWCRIYIRS